MKATASHSLPQTKPPLERFQRITQLLLEHSPRSSAELAERLEVNQKTILRDVEFMRNRLGVELTTGARGIALESARGTCPFCRGRHG